MKSLALLRKITITVIFTDSLVDTLQEHQCRPTYVIVSSNRTILRPLEKKLTENSWMESGRWLLFLDKKISLDEFFINIHIPLNCEFLVAQSLVRSTNVEISLTEVYRIHSMLPLQTYRLANWSLAVGFIWSTVPFNERRGNLNDAAIRAGLSSQRILDSIESCKDRKAVNFCGQIAEIWYTLQETMNFTTRFLIPPDNSYGSLKPDGTWNGVMNLTVDRKVEIGVGRFIYTDKRMSGVSFLPPILISTMSVFIKEPDADDSGWDYVLAPLSSELWLTVLSSMIAFAFFLSVAWYLGNKYGDHPEVENYSLHNSWISIFASVCQQGHDNTPTSWSCRVVFLTSYLTAVIVLVAYSATFISYLTVRKTVLPFTDFKGLLIDGTYKLGVFPNSAQMNYLEGSPDPILRDVFDKLVLPDYDTLPRDDKEGLRRTCSSNSYAYLISPFFVRQHSGDYDCSVAELPDAFFQISASIIVNKNSPYRRLFTHRLQQMRRNGILHAITEKYLPFKIIDDDPKPPQSVTLKKSIPMFIIYVIGILASVVLLLVEFLIHRCNIRYRTSLV